MPMKLSNRATAKDPSCTVFHVFALKAREEEANSIIDRLSDESPDPWGRVSIENTDWRMTGQPISDLGKNAAVPAARNLSSEISIQYRGQLAEVNFRDIHGL